MVAGDDVCVCVLCAMLFNINTITPILPKGEGGTHE